MSQSEKRIDYPTEKIDSAIKQIEKDLFVIDNVEPIDFVLEVCQRKNYRQAYVFYLKYKFLSFRNNNDESIRWLVKTIEQSKIDNDHELHMKSLIDQSDYEYEKGKYAGAAKILMQCLEYAVKLGNTDVVGQIITNIGKIYFSLNRHDIAKQYHKKAWETAIGSHNKLLKADICINLAIDCLELQQPDEAFQYLTEGEKHLEGDKGKSHHYGDLMINLGKTKAQLGFVQEAVMILKFIYSSNIGSEFKWQRLQCEMNLGRIHLHNKEYEQADQWFSLALETARRIKSKRMEMTVLYYLYDSSLGAGLYESAIAKYMEYGRIYDEIYKHEGKSEAELPDDDASALILKSNLALLYRDSKKRIPDSCGN